MFDYLIVGAGSAGSVLAERLASQTAKRALVVDRRNHVGGNAYDCHDDAGILIHKYGPHIFHTNSHEVLAYLSQFTAWRPYQHRVRARVDGQTVPIPINLATINTLYGTCFTTFELDRFFASVAEPCEAIRQVNPAARLVQTDDLGKTYSTPRLAYQASFENERRWLSWDLLCGAVGPGHPMWDYLHWAGVDAADLAWFLDHPCPPDVLGVNSYITSERVLDEYLEPYPPDRRGGNGRDAYADMEAVRVRAEGIGGWRVLIAEAWKRYHLPIALTEVHIGSTRDDQLRWLLEAWTTCHELRDQQGVDVRAVTAWSLFGAFDWNHLVTCGHNFYEPGVFDVRAPQPRPTALAWLVRGLASNTVPSRPVLEGPGWWRRPDRLTVRPLWAEATTEREVATRRAPAARPQPRPVLITGAGGTLGRAYARLCAARGLTSACCPARTRTSPAPGRSAMLWSNCNPGR